MRSKNRPEELSRKAKALADVFNSGFNETINKPEFTEYFYKITPQNKERVREEILGFITHALPVLLRMNGYLHDSEEVGTFVEQFVNRVGGWDDSLFKRIEEYRSPDRERGDALSSATQIYFAKRCLLSFQLGRNWHWIADNIKYRRRLLNVFPQFHKLFLWCVRSDLAGQLKILISWSDTI